MKNVVKRVFCYLKTGQIFSHRSKVGDPQAIKSVYVERFIESLSVLISKGNSFSDSVDCAIYIFPEKHRGKILENIKSAGDGKNIPSLLVEIFPNILVYRELLTESMNSGELAKTLHMISARLKYEREIYSQIKSAIVYPGILLCISFLATISMLVFIVPQISKSINSSQIKLGLMSRVVFYISYLLVERLFLSIGLLVLIISVAVFYRKYILSRIVTFFIKTPILYKGYVDYELALFWSYISLSYFTSRNLNKSFSEGAKSIKNYHISTYLKKISENIIDDFTSNIRKRFSEGKTSKFLSKDSVDYWCASISIQLKSGSLDSVFLELADYHRVKNEGIIKIVSKLSEPVAMLLIGGVIGLISIAMLSPFYEMTEGISAL